ncbi:glomulin-like [Betta splendens]|uniref:Glomulin-like n=1 Tax=Betta splendens TaxID=158456 RepID=A0A6P7M8H1_BETSP|nr:glomulin-like [Betta splendens]
MMKEDQVNDVIQRWRDTPEEDLKSEDYEQMKTLGFACLAEDNSALLLQCIQDEKNQGILKSMGFVLIVPVVSELAKKRKSAENCQAATTHLIEICKTQEVLQSLLALIEDIGPGGISDNITAVVPHLKTVLFQLDHNKATYVGLALSALQRHLARLPVPYTQQQEEADEYGLCSCCTAVAEFTKSVVEEVTKKDGTYGSTTEDEELKTELLKFCIKSLREPLLEAELNQGRKSSLWFFATQILVTLPAVQQPLSDLLFFDSLKKRVQIDNSHSKESKACLSYLLFVQLITIDSFPAVFSPVFVLQCNMDYINELLSSKKESHLRKGLALYAKCLESVQDNSLTVSLLELQSFYTVPQNLRQVLTDCPMQHVRETGLGVFQLFINKLDAEAKHRFFRCMLKTSHHAGVESFIIKNIKSQVDFSMKPSNATKWFLGTEFLSLLEPVLCLPQGAETDLLNSMDRIMETLNLLRYLLIRDVKLRGTDLWEGLCRIKDNYLKMLRVCINLSRAYYSVELQTLKNDKKLKVKEDRDAARAMALVKSIKPKMASNTSLEVQHQVLQSALVTFDLMESLIVRIEELTEEKLKTPD